MHRLRFSFSILALSIIAGCGGSSGGPPPYATTSAINAEPTQVFWGDTHLHTSYSPDAFFFGNTSADPDTAYRYAKGLPVVHPYHKARIQIHTPLDFLVVSDHAEMMGVPFRLAQGDEKLSKTANGKRLTRMLKAGKGQEVFIEFIERINSNRPYDDLNTEETRRSRRTRSTWRFTSRCFRS